MTRIVWRKPLGFHLVTTLLLLVCLWAWPSWAGRPDLVLRSSVNPEPVALGELLTYQLALTNLGNGSASSVTVVDLLSSNATFFSATLSQGTFTQSAGTVTLNFGTLASGAGATATLVVTPGVVGPLTNFASATEAETDANPADNAVSQTTLVAPLAFYAGPNLNAVRAYHTATLLKDGRVLIAGGNNSTGTLASAELFDPQSRTCTLVGNMKSPRYNHAATLLNDGTVLLTGGYGPNGSMGAELFDPATGTFTSVSNMNYAHVWHTATLLLDGRVLVEGNMYSSPYNAAEIYVPALHSFTNIPGTLDAATWHSAFRLADGRVLLPGGTVAGDWYTGVKSEYYDPAQNLFVALPPLNRTRYLYGGAQLLDGRVLLAGGNMSGNSAELFYTNSQSFVLATNSMRALHYFATANRLPGGKVLVCGWSAQAELFNPADDSFSLAVPMLTGRMYYTATSLANGSVLFAGGITGGWGPMLDTTELYEPARTRTPPTLSIGDASVVEGNSGFNTLSFQVSLSTPMGWPVSVDYSTASGSAESGTDFLPAAGRLSFPPGVTNQTVQVTVLGDIDYESDESFPVILSNPTNALLLRAEGTGTILNDDTNPVLSIASASVYESNRGTTNIAFNLFLSAHSCLPITVNFATLDGTALAGSDYVSTSGTLVFEPGVTNLVLNVTVNGDMQIEPDETFSVQLSGVANASFANDLAIGTILDDDGSPGWLHHFEITWPPARQFATAPLPLTVYARDALGGIATNFTGHVLLSVGTTDEAPQHFGFEDGVLGDWSPLNGGSQPGPYEIRFFDLNGDGDASWAFRTAAGYGGDGISRQVPLIGGHRYYVSGDFAESNEGGGNNGGDTLAYLSLGGSALAGCHFGGVIGGQVLRSNLTGVYVAPYSGSFGLSLIFSRDPWSEYYPIGAFADDIVLSAAPITPRWTAHFTNGVWSGINVISLPATNYMLYAEDEEGHRGVSSVLNLEPVGDLGLLAAATTSPRVGTDLVVTLTVTNGGPGAVSGILLTNLLPPGPDFVSATSSLGTCALSNGVVRCELGTLQPGQTATITITTRPASPGTLTNLAGVWPSGYEPQPANNTANSVLTVGLPLLAVQGTAVSESANTTTNLLFVVSVGLPHNETIDVDYATVDGTATAGLDYLPTSGHLTFPPGTASQIVSVTVLDDTLAEVTESFRLQLSNPTNAAFSGSGYGTGLILDNQDPIPQASINDVVLLEGDSGTTNAVFTVSLSRLAGYSIAMNFITANGTATTPSDYTTIRGTVTFAPGQTNQTITVPVKGDTVYEPDEVFYVNLSTNLQGPPVILLRAQGACTILNDDSVPGRLDHFVWTIPSPWLAGRPMPVTLSAQDAFGNPVTNVLGPIPLSATGGIKNTNVPLSPTQAVSFVNSLWTSNITILGPTTNVVLRADDGQQHVGVTAPFDVLAGIAVTLRLPVGATEGAGLLAGQGSLTAATALGSDVLFTLASSDTSELLVPATVTLPAGHTNVSFDLTVVDDALLDGTQTPTVSVSAPGYVTTNAQMAIYDNETVVLTLTVASSNVVETAGVILGTVTLSATPADNITVLLSSSTPAEITVPASITVPAGQTAKTFPITVVNDNELDGPRTVVLTAHVQNWTDGVASVTVQDDDTNTVTIAFAAPGPNYSEGSGLVSNATIRLGGSVTTNLTVTFYSSDPASASVPATVVVPAGTNSVRLPLTIPDDALLNGTRAVLLTPGAPGFVSLPASITVADNDVHHLELSSLPASIEANAAVPLTLLAKDINNLTMSNLSGVVSLLATNASGSVPMSPSGVSLTAGQWSGTLSFPSWEFTGVRLVAAVGGVVAVSAPFNIQAPTLSVVSASGADLAYSALNGRLYVNSTDTYGGGYLTPINAFQAQAESAIYIGSLAGRMVAADSGEYLYLERTGGNLCRFNVSANAADLFWNCGAPQVEDMAAVPGRPTAVAVSRMDTAYSPRTRGTVIFDNGIQLPNAYGGGNVIEFGASPSRLYVYNNEITSFEFVLLNVDATGIHYEKAIPLMAGFHVDFACRAGLVFASTGQLFAPERGIQIGANPAGLMVAGSADEGRFYYWQNLGGSQSAIVACDTHTLLPVGSTLLPGVSTATGSLLRWATNGLAFRINGSQVAIVRSALVPSGLPADLVLSLAAASPSPLVGSPYTCTFLVSNAGPNLARNVVLTETAPATATFVSATCAKGTAATVNGGVACTIPVLTNGETATVSVTLQPVKAGPLAFKVGLTSATTDPNLVNNRLSLNVPAQFVSGFDSVIELALTANDLVYDRANARLCASVPNANELLGNSIVTFDPLSGFYPSLIPTATEPGRLAVADNGQYLYIGLNSEPSIQRIDLAARTADLKFPTGYNGVNDIEVMPGHAEVVAATVHTTVALYENGVKRPNVVAPSPYNFGYSLEFGASSNRLYASYPHGFRRIQVDMNGASLLEDVSDALISDYAYDFEFSGGLAYCINGRVFDPEAKTLVATLPYYGLVVGDAASSQVYYLTSSGSTAVLHVLDRPAFAERKAITINGISGSPASLVRWGADGLALRTTGGQVFLVRSTATNDRDADGLPDAWETQYFSSIYAPGAGPNDDPDHDGLTNLQELQAGSNPLVSDSLCFLSCRQLADGSFSLSVRAVPGRPYTLFASSTLSDWVPILSFTPTNNPTTLTDLSSYSFSQRFYRLGPAGAAPSTGSSARPTWPTGAP